MSEDNIKTTSNINNPNINSNSNISSSNKPSTHRSPYSSFYGGSESSNINTNTNSGFSSNLNSNETIYGTQSNKFIDTSPSNNYGTQPVTHSHYSNIYEAQPTQITHQPAQPIQQIQPVETSSQITNAPTTKPFQFFPSVEAVNQSNLSQLGSTSKAIHQVTPHLAKNSLEASIATGIYTGKSSSGNLSMEEIKLKTRFTNLVYRNYDLLPENVRGGYRNVQFVRTFTMIGIFLHFAFRTGNMLSSGSDNKQVWRKSLQFLAFYFGSSMLFSAMSQVYIDRGFDNLFLGMPYPNIEMELNRYRETTPLLKY